MNVENPSYNLSCYSSFQNEKLNSLYKKPYLSQNKNEDQFCKSNAKKNIKEIKTIALISSIVTGIGSFAHLLLNGAKCKEMLLKSAACSAISAFGTSLMAATILFFKDNFYIKSKEQNKENLPHPVVIAPVLGIGFLYLKSIVKVLNR